MAPSTAAAFVEDIRRRIADSSTTFVCGADRRWGLLLLFKKKREGLFVLPMSSRGGFLYGAGRLDQCDPA